MCLCKGKFVKKKYLNETTDLEMNKVVHALKLSSSKKSGNLLVYEEEIELLSITFCHKKAFPTFRNVVLGLS